MKIIKNVKLSAFCSGACAGYPPTSAKTISYLKSKLYHFYHRKTHCFNYSDIKQKNSNNVYCCSFSVLRRVCAPFF